MINWKDNKVPQPPYYASIFNYLLSDELSGYAEMDDLTLKLAQETEGYLGYESHKSEGRGSFISYWRDLESIDRWRKNEHHLRAKQKGKSRWYNYYHSMIAEVKHAHFHELDQG